MERLLKWFRSFVVIHNCQSSGAFSRDITTNSSPQCGVFGRTLKIKKLKAPLFRGPEGAGIQMTGA